MNEHRKMSKYKQREFSHELHLSIENLALFEQFANLNQSQHLLITFEQSQIELRSIFS